LAFKSVVVQLELKQSRESYGRLSPGEPRGLLRPERLRNSDVPPVIGIATAFRLREFDSGLLEGQVLMFAFW
jgi:hypothetical protein